MDEKIKLLQKKLKDDRGKQVVFLSHCLLNENARYLGGACRKAGVNEIINYLQKQGIGIIQMQCPEQKAWGGVLKRKMLIGYGIKNSYLNYFRKPYMWFFTWHTKRIYRKFAQEIVLEIYDYLNSGYQVLGIVGVKGSPSCGVSAALDLEQSAEFVANLHIDKLDRDYFNEHCYKQCLVTREGLFISALKKELLKRNITINFYEHDLLAEIKGKILEFKL